jgi:hypothetical protein
MAATDTASRIAPYIEQLLKDDTAQKNFRLGAENLRDAYARSQKRRVNPATDKKLLRQLQAAADSLGDGVSELVHGAQKPKKRRGRRLVALLAVGGLAAGVALTFNDDLRASLLGSGSASAEQRAGSSDAV